MLDWHATWHEMAPPPPLAVLPLGSMEQHGPHLPLCCDALFAARMSDAVAKELDAWLLPTQPFSCAQEHQNIPGTISLRPATLGALLTDIADSVARAGVRRLVVLNFHGGNWALHSIIRDYNRQQQRIVVILSQPYENVPGVNYREDLHAGAFETSLVLHLQPALVRSEEMHDYIPHALPAHFDQLGMEALSPTGVWGEPTRATAARGEQDWQWMLANTLRLIRDTLSRLDT